MASGKTTFGRAAAERLGWDFVDLDARIEARYGTTADIFATHGESFFRDIETQMLSETLRAERNTVLALGGGTILREENLRLVKVAATLLLRSCAARAAASMAAVSRFSLSTSATPWI